MKHGLNIQHNIYQYTKQNKTKQNVSQLSNVFKVWPWSSAKVLSMRGEMGEDFVATIYSQKKLILPNFYLYFSLYSFRAIFIFAYKLIMQSDWYFFLVLNTGMNSVQLLDHLRIYSTISKQFINANHIEKYK